ncbi:14644_t:CDS:2 [Cetraspora pellucida]|uniref:14644_t:CDS:1 n=1 Tax=Cetraspora pellucida TaxID=1433469 RepID=A0A9N9IIQ5_9GLOM|nr:14644_t:CDS:2 [Cetraspora pellucida]
MHILKRKDQLKKVGYFAKDACFATNANIFLAENCGSPKFECKCLHKNDANNGLRILDYWILRMVKITDESKKIVFLMCLVSILPTFFDIKSFPVTANSPILLFVKIVLRLEHVNLANIVDQKFNFTSETALDLGKALGIAT